MSRYSSGSSASGRYSAHSIMVRTAGSSSPSAISSGSAENPVAIKIAMQYRRYGGIMVANRKRRACHFSRSASGQGFDKGAGKRGFAAAQRATKQKSPQRRIGRQAIGKPPPKANRVAKPDQFYSGHGKISRVGFARAMRARTSGKVSATSPAVLPRAGQRSPQARPAKACNTTPIPATGRLVDQSPCPAAKRAPRQPESTSPDPPTANCGTS